MAKPRALEARADGRIYAKGTRQVVLLQDLERNKGNIEARLRGYKGKVLNGVQKILKARLESELEAVKAEIKAWNKLASTNN